MTAQFVPVLLFLLTGFAPVAHLALAMPGHSPRQPAPTPALTIAIVNARVWTGDPDRPWAEAVAVTGDRISAVGSSADIRKGASASTRVIDAYGMMLVMTHMATLTTTFGGPK